MTDKMPLVSVVVPVYKVEPYLTKCVTSLVNQTYRNLEILLVDDGSPDRCPELCDAWAENDSRIRVIHKKNGGLSEARNYGIEQASGMYISFVDSDDYVEENYIEVCYRTLIEQNADVSICDIQWVDETGKNLPRATPKVLQKGVCTGEEMLHYYFAFNGVRPILVPAWGKLYKTELFNTIRFCTGRLYEDEYMYFPLYSRVGKVAFAEGCFYHYVQRHGSIMNSAVTPKKVEDLCFLSNERMMLFSKSSVLYKKNAVDSALRVFAVIDRVMEPELVSKMTRIYRRNIGYVCYPCVDIPVHFKLAYLLVAIAPKAAAVILHKRWKRLENAK